MADLIYFGGRYFKSEAELDEWLLTLERHKDLVDDCDQDWFSDR